MAYKVILRVKRHLIHLVTSLLLYVSTMPTQADAVQEYAAKSVLALNLARYSEWPKDVFKGNTVTVNLCLLGSEVVQQAFTMVDKKHISNKILSVLNINDSKQLQDCQLLYISADTDKVNQLLTDSYAHHILTIGETDDFLAKGGMVYLEMADAKINLNVNLGATQKAGLQISARVLKLATIINP
jgi:hypothetical protein